MSYAYPNYLISTEELADSLSRVRDKRGQPGRVLQYRSHDVGNEGLVDAAFLRPQERCRSRRRFRQLAA